jgi:glucan 1,3-beta-glucosidase
MIDLHNFYAYAPNTELDQDEILESICNVSQLLRQNSSSSGIPATVVGEWSLQSGLSSGSSSQAWRTWLRLLFEAQIAAYTPSGPGQPSLGWIFWSWKTEHDVNTWSYRRGIAQGYIPADSRNESLLVYPLLGSGCVDSTYNYTAPASVPSYVAPNYASSTTAGTSASSSAKSGGPSVGRLREVQWALISSALVVTWWVCL